MASWSTFMFKSVYSLQSSFLLVLALQCTHVFYLCLTSMDWKIKLTSKDFHVKAGGAPELTVDYRALECTEWLLRCC